VERKTKKTHVIELKLHDTNQLFNSLDPAPFNTKDLDQDAEEFIVSWALEFPGNEAICLRIHLDAPIAESEIAVINEAIHHYFAYRTQLNRLEFSRLMRQGRVSLMIGLAFLAGCLGLSNFLLAGINSPAPQFLRESVTILGWVAMWRPIEIYLYDWWPIQKRGNIYLKLSRMTIEIVPTTIA
jgi:hypothetical protein